MSSHYAVLDQKKKQANQRISKQMSEYTVALRKKLDKHTDFSAEYQKIFGDFTDRKLPKDDLYYSIKNEIEAKTRDVKKKIKKTNKGGNILPAVNYDDDINETDQKLHKDEVDRQMYKMNKAN